MAPGDPVDILTGQLDTDPKYLEELRREFGLDKPLIVQLGTYIKKVLSFDLGYSLRYRQDVGYLILSRMPATFLLMGTALIMSSLFAILLGIFAARRPYGFADNAATLVALAGYSMPVFWLGQILLLLFGLQLNWFPTQGMISLRAPSEGWGRVVDILRHLILPAITYSCYYLALIFRLTRVKMQEVFAEDYIITARAKGVPEGRVIFHHALRNAMIPIVTVIGFNFAFMMAGSVLTETVFAWPGMGRLMFEAIMARDYPVLLGLFFVVSIMVIMANVVTDIIYAVIDPRVVYK
jgi:peptide/nickel transport system permease protein